MKAAIISKAEQNKHVQALAAGLRRHGVHVDIVPSVGIPQRGAYDFVSCWSWRPGSFLKARRHRVLLMERGYVGDRFAWTSLAWDGLNGNGSVPPVSDGGARWRQHFEALMRPWRSGGDYALLLGQVPGDQSIAGVDMQKFYLRAYAAAMRFGPVKFRPHPVAVQRNLKAPVPRDVPLVYGDLADALAKARCAISYNSNSAVDAVLAGTPAIVCDKGSMAWDVAGHGLDADPPTPDRTEWCAKIAWRQWLLEEIASGAAWEILKAGLDAERIAA